MAHKIADLAKEDCLDKFEKNGTQQKIIVFTFAHEALADEAPEHLGAVVTVGGLVKRFLGKKVPVTEEICGRGERQSCCCGTSQ
jgi:hypothetical protein